MVTIYYLRWDENELAREEFLGLHTRTFEPADRVLRSMYEKIAEDPAATKDTVYGRWNEGSGVEADLFKSLHYCEDCETQVGRDESVEAHVETYHDGASDVEVHRYRSMSWGDLIETDEGLFRLHDTLEEVTWSDQPA